MKQTVLLGALHVAKMVGLFHLARRLTARGLRILCYHGAALRDEDRFRPSLFMRESTFAERMRFLSERGYPVIDLGEAMTRLRQGTLPAAATVITIDDGWYGTYAKMAPILAAHRFPATLYIASYYLERSAFVFNIAVDYVLWRAGAGLLDLARVNPCLSGAFDVSEPSQRRQAANVLRNFGEVLDGAEARQELLRDLCSALALDWEELRSSRVVTFMSRSEAREILARGIDIQLHTHRHRFSSTSFEEAKAEIEDNRRSLATLTDRPLVHFCYPSGEYVKDQFAYLRRLQIETATIGVPGLTWRDAEPLELCRFLDFEGLPQIRFEAEMSGFVELLRHPRKVLASFWRVAGAGLRPGSAA